MVLGRRVEIAHHVGGGRARGFVSAIFGKVRHQALQCRALTLHTVVAGGKHFQRRLGPTGWRGKSWKISSHVTSSLIAGHGSTYIKAIAVRPSANLETRCAESATRD